MGAQQSSLATGQGQGQGQTNFSKAQADFLTESSRASEIPNKILTLMFKHADFKDMLTLSNIDACPQYVFTSAQSLGHLFEQIKIRPERGAAGEYIFAPVRRLAPELLKGDGQAQQPSLDERIARDNMCVDVAYFYVRIFQIYAALAMTVLNTSPLRAGGFVQGPQYRQGNFSAGPAPMQFRQSAFSSLPQQPQARGGLRRTTRRQAGGRIAPSTYTQLHKKVSDSPFAPLLIPYFTVKKTAAVMTGSSTSMYLSMDDKTGPGELLVFWEPDRIGEDMTLKSYYKLRKGYYNNSGGAESPVIETNINMKKRINDSGTYINMYISRNKIATFTEQLGNPRYFLDGDDSKMYAEPAALYARIHEYFDNRSVEPKYEKSIVSQQPSNYTNTEERRIGEERRYTAAAPYAASSTLSQKSSFDGFDTLYKMYGSLMKGEIAAPKAYLVARAMTLMNPIFEFEQTTPDQQVTADICKASRLDFETSSDYLMPRPGTDPKSNIYMRSFVSLFYDTYRIERDKEKKRIVLEKSQPGSSDLAKASKLMARLYNITEGQEDFLESARKFKPYENICGPAASGTIYYSSPQLKQAMRELIMKMLDFQKMHNERVNQIFMRMFDLERSKVEGEKLVFTADLQSRGLASVNDFCKEARLTLLDYYLKSEAFYIEGIMLLENNKDKITTDFREKNRRTF